MNCPLCGEVMLDMSVSSRRVFYKCPSWKCFCNYPMLYKTIRQLDRQVSAIRYGDKVFKLLNAAKDFHDYHGRTANNNDEGNRLRDRLTSAISEFR